MDHELAARTYKKHTGKEFDDALEPGEPESLLEVMAASHDMCYAKSWSRDDLLDMRTKTFVSMAITATLGTEAQFRSHVRAAVHIGVPKEELVGMLMHFVAYLGAPRAGIARRIVREVWKETAEKAKKA